MSYVLKFGDVWLVDGTVETHVCDGSQEIAVAYDPETGTVLKMGAADAIRAWREKHIATLDAKCVRHIFADPIVVAMPVNEDTVDLLNRIRDNSLLVQAMIERGELPGLTAEDADRLQLQG
jgi:hypothetical protein